MSDLLGILSLLNPKYAERIQQQKETSEVFHCKRLGLKKWPDVVGWGDLYLDAESFVKEEDHLVGKVGAKEIVIDSGKNDPMERGALVTLDRIELPADHPIRFSVDEDADYNVCFNKAIDVVRLRFSGQTMMSVTPMECLSQRRGINRTKKHTVVAGLGLGWSLTKILQRDRVERVTVIERHPKLLEKMKKILKAESFGKPIDWICGDMWDVAPKLSADVIFADIWLGYGDRHAERRRLKETCPNIKSFWLWGIGGSADYSSRY